MPIHSVTVGNFKGIAETIEIPIKPITLFIGENSSGKSTVLHALAALSQTASLPNDQRALILDDEKAAVHLGRFIEIIHSRKYSDVIELGVNIGEVRLRRSPRISSAAHTLETAEVKVQGRYAFKSTRRTQEVSISTAEVQAGDEIYRIKRGTTLLSVENTRTGTTGRFATGSGFILRERVMSRKFSDFVAFIMRSDTSLRRSQKLTISAHFGSPLGEAIRLAERPLTRLEQKVSQQFLYSQMRQYSPRHGRTSTKSRAGWR
jgi:predicted ATPase